MKNQNPPVTWQSIIRNPFFIGFGTVALGILIYQTGHSFGQWIYGLIN